MRRRTNQALSHEQVRFLASHQASSVTVGVLSLRVCVLSRGLCAGWINLGFELPIGGLDWQIWGSVRNKLWPQCPFGKHDFLPMFCRWYLGYVVDKYYCVPLSWTWTECSDFSANWIMSLDSEERITNLIEHLQIRSPLFGYPYQSWWFKLSHRSRQDMYLYVQIYAAFM